MPFYDFLCSLNQDQPSHPGMAMQDSDREKLHLARQRHAFEEQEADLDALKERRKEERAAKRAARKEAASLKIDDASNTGDSPRLISRSRVTVGSTAISRQASSTICKCLNARLNTCLVVFKRSTA